MVQIYPSANSIQLNRAISVVIPIHNENPVIHELLDDLVDVLRRRFEEDFEILVVDDGSTDESFRTLRSLQKRIPELCVVQLPSQNGQSAALWVGMLRSRGRLIASMDGDGQFFASDLIKLAELVLDRFEFAIGMRVDRQDTRSKKLFSRSANQLRRWLTGSIIPDSGCSLRVFRRSLLTDLLPFQGLHRFMPTIFERSGRTFGVLPVSHSARRHGKSHYGIASRALLSFADLAMLWWFYKRCFDTQLLLEQECNEIANQDSIRDHKLEAVDSSISEGIPTACRTRSFHSGRDLDAGTP